MNRMRFFLILIITPFFGFSQINKTSVTINDLTANKETGEMITIEYSLKNSITKYPYTIDISFMRSDGTIFEPIDENVKGANNIDLFYGGDDIPRIIKWELGKETEKIDRSPHELKKSIRIDLCIVKFTRGKIKRDKSKSERLKRFLKKRDRFKLENKIKKYLKWNRRSKKLENKIVNKRIKFKECF